MTQTFCALPLQVEGSSLAAHWERRNVVAGYAEIATHFRRQIESGSLRPGDRLPTLREVMQQFE
ncbi:GntR family transcriptional regulator, partial [Saccharopolyspora shandongensis]|uniref:GntR family transcriptional regulator n=1 Tax=Saccharopolyspora shandongensis TaxID=418495 RepID=UPI00340292D1